MISYSFLLKINSYIPVQGYPQGYMFHVPVLRDLSTIISSKRSHNCAFPIAALWQPLKPQHARLYFQIPSAAVPMSLGHSDHLHQCHLPRASSAALPGSRIRMRSAQWLPSFIGIVQKREIEIKEWRDLKVPEGNKLFKSGDFVVVALYHWWNLLHINKNIDKSLVLGVMVILVEVCFSPTSSNLLSVTKLKHLLIQTLS